MNEYSDFRAVKVVVSKAITAEDIGILPFKLTDKGAWNISHSSQQTKKIKLCTQYTSSNTSHNTVYRSIFYVVVLRCRRRRRQAFSRIFVYTTLKIFLSLFSILFSSTFFLCQINQLVCFIFTNVERRPIFHRGLTSWRLSLKVEYVLGSIQCTVLKY